MASSMIGPEDTELDDLADKVESLLIEDKDPAAVFGENVRKDNTLCDLVYKQVSLWSEGKDPTAVLVENVRKWKEEEMESAVSQINRIYKIVTGGRDIMDPSSESSNALSSLTKVFELLEPATLDPSQLATALLRPQLDLLTKKQRRSALVAQRKDIKKKEAELKHTAVQFRERRDLETLTLSEYKAETQTADINEIIETTASYRREIEAERCVWERVERLKEMYTEEKVVEKMKDVKGLDEAFKKLESELSFSAVLPPNWTKAKEYVQQRKDHLHSLIQQIEDKSAL